MTFPSFAKQLVALTTLVAVLLLILHQWPIFGTYQSFSWISLLGFFLLIIAMYIMGKCSAADPNKSLFVSISILLGGGKMLLSVLLVIVYSKWVQPSSRGFVVPFFLVYLSFTIFETYFMMKLAQEKGPS